MTLRQPDDPGVSDIVPARPWWLSWQSGAAAFGMVVTLLAAAALTGRTLQRIDDMDGKLASAIQTLDRIAAVTNDTAVSVARIQGALDVPARHAERDR